MQLKEQDLARKSCRMPRLFTFSREYSMMLAAYRSMSGSEMDSSSAGSRLEPCLSDAGSG